MDVKTGGKVGQTKEVEAKKLEEIQDFIAPFKKEYEFLLKSRQEAKKLRIKIPKSQKQVQRTLRRQLKKLFQIIEAGYEPFTPNSEWFCGLVEEKGFVEMDDRFPSGWRGTGRLPVYSGILPSSVLKAYQKAKKVFGWNQIVIYDPNPDHFKMVGVSRDPVMVGYHQVGEKHLHFLIKAWNLGEDLSFMDKTKTS